MANFNDIKDKGLLSNRGEDLLSARRERIEQKSVAEVRVLEKLVQDQADLDKLYENIHQNYKSKLAQITTIAKRMEELKKLADRLEKGRHHHASSAFQTGVRTHLGARSTREDITSIARSADTFGTSISMAEGVPTSELESRVRRHQSLLTRQESRIAQTAGQIDEPGMEARFRLQMSARQRIMRDIGTSEEALRTQRKMGLDIRSQYHDASEFTQRVTAGMEKKDIAAGVSAGVFGSRSSVEGQLNEVSTRLIDTFQKLDEAIKSGSKETDELSKEFGQLKQQYQRHKQTLDEMNRQGAGGGGILDRVSAILSGGGAVAQAGAQLYRHAGVTSELQQMQQRMNIADITNLRYTDAAGAARGDMSSLRRVLSRTYDDSVARGELFRSREDLATGAETLGTAARAGGAATGGQIGAGAAQGLQAARMGIDFFKDIPQMQAFTQATMQHRQAQDIISRIDDQSAQTASDYLRNITLATRGLGTGSHDGQSRETTTYGSGLMGGGARTIADIELLDAREESKLDRRAVEQLGSDEARARARRINERTTVRGDPISQSYDLPEIPTPMLTQAYSASQGRTGVSVGREDGYSRRESLAELLMDTSNVDMLAGVGLNQADIARLARSGTSMLGLHMGGQEGLDTIRDAGRFSQAGYFDSPDQYMQARATLTGVGGDRDTLERTLRQAITAGLDTSKNLMQIVDATRATAERSAAVGVSTADATSSMLMRGAQGQISRGVDPNMAVSAAQRSLMQAEQFGRSTDLDIFNVLEFAGLRRDFEDAEMWELEALSTVSPAELRQLQKLAESDPEKFQQEANRLGLGGVLETKEDVDRAMAHTQDQVIGRTVGMGMNRELEDEIREGLQEGLRFEELSGRAQNFLNARGNIQGFSGSGIYDTIGGGEVAEGEIKEALGLGPTTKSGEDLITAEALTGAKEFAHGMEIFNDAIGGIESLGAVLKGVAENLEPSAFAKATKEAADNLKAPMHQFESNMRQFNANMHTILDRMERVLGTSRPTGADRTNPNMRPIFNE